MQKFVFYFVANCKAINLDKLKLTTTASCNKNK